MAAPTARCDEESSSATTTIDDSTARPVDRQDVVSEEENLLAGGEPLTVPDQYISEAKFWFKVLTPWPLTWLVGNVLALGTLEYAKMDHYYGFERGMWLLVIEGTIWCVNAWLVYKAANFVEQQVQALDDLQEQSEGDPLLSMHSNLDHVHARSSRRLDEFLGRRSRHSSNTGSSIRSNSGNHRRHSVLVSLLLLSCVNMAPMGCALMLRFAVRGLATFLCSYLPPPRSPSVKADVPGIPKSLQFWAKYQGYTGSWDDHQWKLGDFVRLIDGTSFVATQFDTSWMSALNSAWREPWDPVLVKFTANGGMQVLTDVVHPQKFVILQRRNESSVAAAAGFCCLYKWSPPSPKADFPTISILCADSSDSASSLARQSGEIRNVTLFDPNHLAPGQFGSAKRSFKSALLELHDGVVWAKVLWTTTYSSGTVAEIFNLTVQESAPLILTPVANVSDIGPSFRYSCEEWQFINGNLAYFAILMRTSYWLMCIRNLPVGVVPTFGIAYVLFGWSGLEVLVSWLVSFASLVTLLGRKVPFLHRLGSEASVWLLYTSICVPVMGSYWRYYGGWKSSLVEDHAVVAFLQGAVAGCILGHPFLVIVGWIGGVGCVLIGVHTFLYVSNEKVLHWFLTGVIGGIGCVTAGNLQANYQEFMWFYSKRAWNAVMIRLQRVAMGASPSQPMTAGLLDNSD